MYYKRDLESKIEQYLDRSEIIAIFGPRQVGKTTLLKEFYNRVENPIFLTFEDIELKVLFEDNIHNHISFNSSQIASRDKLENKNLDFFSEERTKINININSNDTRIEKHLETFNIEGLYNNHTDVVADLYKKELSILMIILMNYLQSIVKFFKVEKSL